MPGTGGRRHAEETGSEESRERPPINSPLKILKVPAFQFRTPPDRSKPIERSGERPKRTLKGQTSRRRTFDHRDAANG